MVKKDHLVRFLVGEIVEINRYIQNKKIYIKAIIKGNRKISWDL
jgi:hypothetical protein